MRYNPADGENIQAQRFAATGDPVGPAARIDTTRVSSQARAMGATGGGGFVISWSSTGQDGDAGGIYARRFDAHGLRGGPR